MKLREFYDIIDSLAPFSLSEQFMARGHHDNSGLILECGDEVNGALFSLDLSLAAVEAAKKAGADCIVTHHPAIWMPVAKIDTAHEEKLVACIRAGISVISAHLNLDAAIGGIDESLMLGLGGKQPRAVLEELQGGSYGRVFDVEESSPEAFAERAGKVFGTKRILVYGSRPVRRVACFCGAGLDADSIAFAAREGADAIVSSDAKHHLITETAERGMDLILLTLYASENYGFMRFAEAVRKEVGIPVSAFTDERYL